ncbi:unnamed protein product [Caenorhabditis auriculariae]|uniref:Ig-like domain-containing protein n=1 Tax=Caenorhabditis auriculariae TaxID=2777116 RepID=A0A8S1HHS2_9PELO|nr:unnamed protein product [Caenorhabditis auriculariae]
MLLLLFLLLYQNVATSSTCPAVCSCFRDVVDCSSRDLLDVPAGIPNSTRTLNLSGNDIDLIEFDRIAYLPFLTTLDLSNNILRHIDTALFRKVRNVRVLHLRRNRLIRVPDGIAHLQNLEKIDLRSNSISKLSNSDLSMLASVRHVDLSRNLIANLPRGRLPRKSKVERLDMASNLLREVPADVFISLPSLISLRLSRNKIGVLQRNSFHRLPYLESLDLSRNALRTVPSLVFNDLPSLLNVSLSKNEVHRLGDGIFLKCDSLAMLNVSHNRVATISEGWLFGLQSLKYLDISFNHVTSFEPNAWSHCPHLRWLSLYSNRLQSLPSGSFRALSHLEELNLSGNSIENLHKTAMTGLDSLHRLDLSSNRLAVCVEDGAVLYNTSMPFLKWLRFTNNQLRVIPNRAFERFPALEVLDLSDNPIATIHPGAFEPLHLKKLMMNSSSILCDCQIAWFGSWLYDSRLDRSTVVAKCAHPPPLKSLDVVAIDVANLTCADYSPRARVIAQPISVRTLVKENARFTCTGYGHGPISIEWRVFENGKPRVLVQDSTTIINTNTTAVINGTMDGHELTAGELILHEVALSDRAEYQCVVRNRFGPDFSTLVKLEVLQPPSFLHEPDDMALLVGQNAKFMCAASGTPQPLLKWAYDGGESFPAAEERRLYVVPNDDHLYVMNVSLSDQGVYTCNATSEAGHIQASATLRVFKNAFQTHLQPRTVLEGDAVMLECLVDLIPGAQRMIWTKDGSEIKPHHSVRVTTTAHGQIFVISKMHLSDSGEYGCELWAGGTLLIRQSARITVAELPFDESRQESNRALHVQGVLAASWQPTNENFVVGLALFLLIITVSIVSLICTGICVWLRRFLQSRRQVEQAYV